MAPPVSRPRAGEGSDWSATDTCVVLACDGEYEECGVFSCADLAAEGELDAQPVQFRPPPRSTRSWRRVGLKPGASPRAVIHFRYRHGYLPAFPRGQGKLVKHHMFCQAPDLAAWFQDIGINIHQWTMLIPEATHLRIHRGLRGGAWNNAWREYQETLRKDGRLKTVTKEELIAHAFKLSFRFDIAGPIVRYHEGLPPPGPQLFGAP